jgi:hypothetical protein
MSCRNYHMASTAIVKTDLQSAKVSRGQRCGSRGGTDEYSRGN